MEYREIGNTGIKISLVSFGTLTMSHVQKNMSPKDGSILIEKAIESGINYFDSAEIYDTYRHIGYKKLPDDVMIGAKSYAYEYNTMQESIEKALRETKRDVIDVFMLHQQESELTLRGHKPAIDCMLNAKEKGLIRLIGVSTHHIDCVKAAIDHEEIDIIFAIFNYRGLGIIDGTALEMQKALEKAYNKGKGIFIMKGLGGGHCFREPQKAFGFLRQFPFITSVVIGMQNEDEIKYNISMMNGLEISKELSERLVNRKRYLKIEHEGCQRCGNCVRRCDQKALSLTENGIVVNRDKCILCGYCASVCPDFCLEVI